MNGMKIHSDVAWEIASQYSYTLASDTRTLAAQIDVAINEAKAGLVTSEQAQADVRNFAAVVLNEWESQGIERMNQLLRDAAGGNG